MLATGTELIEGALYPELLESANPHVRETARRLHADLAALYQRWNGFIERWPDAEAIDARTNRFRRPRAAEPVYRTPY